MKERLRKNSWQLAISNWRIATYLCLFVAILFSSCNFFNKKKNETEEKKYACEMYCDSLLFDKPGTCPVCQMDLEEKGGVDIHTPAKPTNQSVISSIKTIHPEQKKVPVIYTANGYISYGTRTLNNISSRYSGRIERLSLKYYFQHIEKGEKLFEIYSPDIVTVQENLIYLLTKDPDAKELINATRKKLLLLGLTEEQLKHIEKTKQVEMLLPVYSPYEGHLHVMADNQMKDNMNNLSSPELPVKQGMYVKKGQTLFNLVNPHKVWATLRIYAEDVSKIKLHQAVELMVEGQSDSVIKGEIDLIEPSFEAGSKNLNVRVNITNPEHQLKMGLLIKAKIISDTVNGLWIPKTAMIDLGKNKVVWLKKHNVFEVHKIQTGSIENNWVEVTDGLTEEDEIAHNAQYLMDSESFIKIANDDEEK